MDYFPLFFKLEGREVLLVGGGAVAARKLRLLLKTPATITLVAPRLHAETEAMARAGGWRWLEGEYRQGMLDRQAFVIVATDKPELNAEIAQHCKQRNIPVNVVDQPELCTVITPAIVDRSPLVVAISSFGSAPVLARKIRQQIETSIPAATGKFAAMLGRYRQRITQTISDSTERLRFWQDLMGSEVEAALARGNEQEAEQRLLARIEASANNTAKGEVYLVGAGPGDPELLTLKALRLMQQADVVLYDRLVSDGVMELLRRDAERIYVGKRRDDHALAQGDINQLLADLANQGKRVLRLKGGDPFIFGRGGEELETLAEQGVNFQVVPGVTAASGCAAYAGIPLTHRDHAQSVRFITGHLKNQSSNIRWAELAASDQTLVFYMSLVGLPQICQALIKAGRSAATPAALVEKGSTPEQRVMIGSLSNLADKVAEAKFRAPTLLIIGDVVKLHTKLAWFAKAPEQGENTR
ncbi:MAG: siroheme synthase CysG [Cellvibrionaceae bacterium]|nr:siroheme synthase CysG [Cellvibrionaceae bacterium]